MLVIRIPRIDMIRGYKIGYTAQYCYCIGSQHLRDANSRDKHIGLYADKIPKQNMTLSICTYTIKMQIKKINVSINWPGQCLQNPLH